MNTGMRRFRKWCDDNHFGPTTGYKKLKSGEIKALKVGKLTYITDEEDVRWKKNLPAYNAQNTGA